MFKSIFGDKCEKKNKNDLWNHLNSIPDNTKKLKFLLPKHEVVPPFKRADIEQLVKYKNYKECPDDVNLEAAKLVIAHENAIAEIAKFGEEQGSDIPNGQYPNYKNSQLASEDFIIEKIQEKQEKQPTAGGKKRKYKRKTNKRKTNKRKS